MRFVRRTLRSERENKRLTTKDTKDATACWLMRGAMRFAYSTLHPMRFARRTLRSERNNKRLTTKDAKASWLMLGAMRFAYSTLRNMRLYGMS